MGIAGNTFIDGNVSHGAATSLKTFVSSAATLTIGNSATTYVFSGTTTTWTLPAVSGNTSKVFFMKNRGSGDITLNRAGADNIYDTAAVTSITITPGQSIMIQNDGTYWLVM